MQEAQFYRYPQKPKIIGPFRGILIDYTNNINYHEFKEIYAELTFHHPNFYRSESNKYGSIIYYRYPYDAATSIDKYQNNPNFKISRYNDKLSKTLNPDILYIETKDYPQLYDSIQKLQGTVIRKQQIGIQVKFQSFKQTAIAYEELRKNHYVKFNYKTLAPRLNKQNIIIEKEETIQDEDENKKISEIKQGIQSLLLKYKGWTPALKNEFKKAFEEMDEEDKNNEMITIVKNPTSYYKKSYENGYTSSNSSEPITPSDVFLKLNQMYKEIQKRND